MLPAANSKFVEMASVDNVKTWVNYGGTREWSDPTQGQVGEGGVTKVKYTVELRYPSEQNSVSGPRTSL